MSRARERGDTAGFRKLPFRDERDDVEVRPPERCGHRDAQDRGSDHSRVQLASRADADRDDRLAEGDDDDEPVTLREMRGRYTPAAATEGAPR